MREVSEVRKEVREEVRRLRLRAETDTSAWRCSTTAELEAELRVLDLED